MRPPHPGLSGLSLPLDPAALVGLVDSVEPLTWQGAQRVGRDGQPLWRVTLLVRLPDDRGRRHLPVVVAAGEAPAVLPDDLATPVRPTLSLWTSPDRGLVATCRADGIELVPEQRSVKPSLPSRPAAGGAA